MTRRAGPPHVESPREPRYPRGPTLTRLPKSLGLVLALVVATSLSAPTRALADDKAPLSAAAEKWEAGDITDAVPLYEQAIKNGGLFPPDMVIAHARIGTVLAATGKKEAALSAFRVAAVIDPVFQLPSESGPVAKKLYDDARKQAAKQGGKIEITAEAPERVEAKKSFTVKVKMPDTFVPLVEKIGVEVRDVQAKTPWKADAPAAAEYSFEVPGRQVPGSTTLSVRVSALDSNGNRWAISEVKVKTKEDKSAAEPRDVEPAAPKDDGAKKSMWKGPWPYVVLGVAAVVVTGAAVALQASKAPSKAEIGKPTWN